MAATFLDIPANNVVVLQRKDELFELGAGQHYLTTASVTIRGFYTKGEVQQELECDNIYTRDREWKPILCGNISNRPVR